MHWCICEHQAVSGDASVEGFLQGWWRLSCPIPWKVAVKSERWQTEGMEGLGKILVQGGTLLQKTLKTV